MTYVEYVVLGQLYIYYIVSIYLVDFKVIPNLRQTFNTTHLRLTEVGLKTKMKMEQCIPFSVK